jgi:hypothetical protein
MEALTKEHPALKGYTVKNPYFMVCDSINHYSPLIYSLTDKDMEDAYNGFEHQGKYYPGVKEIIEELQWAIENDKWNISKTNHDLKGVVPLK